MQFGRPGEFHCPPDVESLPNCAPHGSASVVMFGACSGHRQPCRYVSRWVMTKGSTLAGSQRASSTMNGLPIAFAAATCAVIQVLTNVGDGCEAQNTDTYPAGLRSRAQGRVRHGQGSCHATHMSEKVDLFLATLQDSEGIGCAPHSSRRPTCGSQKSRCPASRSWCQSPGQFAAAM